MDDALMNKVDKVWRKIRKLSHVDQLDVLAELTWRCRTDSKIMEEGDDGEECMCHSRARERGGDDELVEITDGSPVTIKERLFRVVWSSLAKKGKVDSLDGHQYRVVHTMWQKANRPIGVKEFILNPNGD